MPDLTALTKCSPEASTSFFLNSHIRNGSKWQGSGTRRKVENAEWSSHSRKQADLDFVAPGCLPHPLWVGRESCSRSLTLSFTRSVWSTGVEGTFFKGQSCLVININSHIYLKGNASDFNFSLFLNPHPSFFIILVYT